MDLYEKILICLPLAVECSEWIVAGQERLVLIETREPPA